MDKDNENARRQLGAAAAGLKGGLAGKLGDFWWFLLLRGIFAILLGVFALFWPDQNLRVLVLAVGIYCLADGVVGVVGALRDSQLREYLFQAVLVLVIGAVLVMWPGATLRTLLTLLGAAVFVAGCGQFLTARRMGADDPEKGSASRVGLVVAVIGLVLAFWPGSGIAIISWVIGIAALLLGALLVFLATRFRRLRARVEGMGGVGGSH